MECTVSLMKTKFVDFTPAVRAFSTNGEQLLSEGIHLKNYQIAGPTCDSLDLFNQDSIQVGDYLEFGMMGAYSKLDLTIFRLLSWS